MNVAQSQAAADSGERTTASAAMLATVSAVVTLGLNELDANLTTQESTVTALNTFGVSTTSTWSTTLANATPTVASFDPFMARDRTLASVDAQFASAIAPATSAYMGSTSQAVRLEAVTRGVQVIQQTQATSAAIDAARSTRGDTAVQQMQTRALPGVAAAPTVSNTPAANGNNPAPPADDKPTPPPAPPPPAQAKPTTDQYGVTGGKIGPALPGSNEEGDVPIDDDVLIVVIVDGPSASTGPTDANAYDQMVAENQERNNRILAALKRVSPGDSFDVNEKDIDPKLARALLNPQDFNVTKVGRYRYLVEDKRGDQGMTNGFRFSYHDGPEQRSWRQRDIAGTNAIMAPFRLIDPYVPNASPTTVRRSEGLSQASGGVLEALFGIFGEAPSLGTSTVLVIHGADNIETGFKVMIFPDSDNQTHTSMVFAGLSSPFVKSPETRRTIGDSTEMVVMFIVGARAGSVRRGTLLDDVGSTVAGDAAQGGNAAARDAAELAAQRRLLELTGETPNAHYLGKHSPLMSDRELLDRAVLGVDPWTGRVQLKSNGLPKTYDSTRFHSYQDMVGAIEKAQDALRAHYPTNSSLPSHVPAIKIDMLRDIGDGFAKNTGTFRTGLTKVKVVFDNRGRVISAFPVYNP